MAEVNTNNKKIFKSPFIDKEIKEMQEAFLGWGLKPSLIHPKAKYYISGIKTNVAVIDLSKTKASLLKAVEFLSKAYKSNKNILFVGTAQPAKEKTKEIAKELGAFFVVEKWLGGLLTNFEEIKKRITYYQGLKQKKENGELEKYPFKERLSLLRELEKLEKNLSGLVGLEKIPDIIFITNISMHKTALAEVQKKNIPVVALTNVDTDISLIDYPIVANDRAKKSVDYILEKIKLSLLNKKSISGSEQDKKTEPLDQKETQNIKQNESEAIKQ